MVTKQPTLATIDKKIDALANSVDTKVDSLAKNIDKKIDALTKSVDTKIGSLTKIVENLAISTKKGFDEVNGRIDGVETRLTEVEKTTTRIENGLSNRLERAEDNIVLIKNHVGIH